MLGKETKQCYFEFWQKKKKNNIKNGWSSPEANNKASIELPLGIKKTLDLILSYQENDSMAMTYWERIWIVTRNIWNGINHYHLLIIMVYQITELSFVRKIESLFGKWKNKMRPWITYSSGEYYAILLLNNKIDFKNYLI